MQSQEFSDSLLANAEAIESEYREVLSKRAQTRDFARQAVASGVVTDDVAYRIAEMWPKKQMNKG